MLQPYLLELGGKLAGRFFDFTGGMAEAEVVVEKLGPRLVSRKHLAGVKYEDIVLVCGTGMSRSFYEWVGSTFNGRSMRKDGAIITLDQNSKPTARLEFQQALITSLALPELDASGKDPAYLTVSIKPERTSFKKSTEALDLGVYTPASPKAWHIADFRIRIDGLDNDCRHVTHIKPLRLGQEITKDWSGEARESRLEPTKIEFSNVAIELPALYADGFFKWHADFVEKGKNSPDREKDGSLDFLAPGSSTPYFGLKLDGLGIYNIKQAGGSLPVTVEMYCHKMTFSAGAAAIK